MPLRLDAASPDFAAGFAPLVAAKREARPMSTPPSPRSSPMCAQRGDAALLDYTRAFDRLDLDRRGPARARRTDRARR